MSGEPIIVVRPEELPPEGDSEPPRPRRRDPMALASLVTGVLSILFVGVALGPVAILTGIIALTRSRAKDERHALPVAGVACGFLGFLVWGGLALHFLAGRAQGEARPAVPARDPGGTLDLAAIERSPAPVRQAMRAHVSILAERMEGGSWNLVASGSGVASAVGPGRLLILTCRHVVEPSTGPGTRIRLVWFGGSAQDAVVRWQSAPALDLALVECRPAPGTALPQVPPTAGLDRISVGQGVLAVGDPLNFRGSLVRGSLSALRSMGEGSAQVRVIQSQIPLNPGNSGGGLYTDEGMLIGINSWTIAKDRAEGMGFSVALDSLGARLDELPPDLAEDLRTWLQARAATDTSGAQQIGR